MSDVVRAVERALAILNCFDANNSVLGVTEIAGRLGLPKSTVHRILGTLESQGFVQQDPVTSQYQLGLKLMELGALVGTRAVLRQVSLPMLQALSGETEETVLLVVYDEGDVVYLDALECPQPVKIDARPGRRLPAYCTGSGKAFLSFMPQSEVESVIAGPLTARTPNTITDPAKLRENLAETRRRGYSISNEEYAVGIRAVGAPILSQSGEIWGVVAVAGPAFRLPDERIRVIGERTVAAARQISERIRYGTCAAP